MADFLGGIGFMMLLIGCAGMDSVSLTVPIALVCVGLVLILICAFFSSISVEKGDEYDDL